MSQNDLTIANQGFPAFRSDLNSALQAIASNSAGATAPSTTFANMWWYDTSSNSLYIRNEDNDAWIKVAELNQTTDKFIGFGTLKLEDGTESVPALTFDADTNTGLYRGGTDILKFVTAGTDAITIDASQNVTIVGTLGVTGVLTGTSLDISADIDVDGTTNLDIVDIDGAVDMASTLQVDGVPTFTGRSVHSGGITIANAGQIGSVGDPDAISIASDGVVTFTQTPVGAGGGAQAWVNFNGQGTPVSGVLPTRDSFNVTTLTDGGVGSYVMNFTTAFGSVNYSATGSMSVLIGAYETIFVPNFTPPGTETASLTTAFQFACLRPSTTVRQDVVYAYAQIFD